MTKERAIYELMLIGSRELETTGHPMENQSLQAVLHSTQNIALSTVFFPFFTRGSLIEILCKSQWTCFKFWSHFSLGHPNHLLLFMPTVVNWLLSNMS